MSVMGRRVSFVVFVLGATLFIVGCGDDEPAAGDEAAMTDAADGNAELVAACDLRREIVRDLQSGAVVAREEVVPRLEDLMTLAESSGSQEAEELVGEMWDAYFDRDTDTFVRASIDMNSICPVEE